MANLITVNDLKVHFVSKQGILSQKTQTVKAVDSISFSIPKGKTVGLVGESGSGKSTTGKAIARLVPMTGGSIFYNETLISDLSEREFYSYRKKIQMVFQDPFGSLNPRMNIESSISEPMQVHFKDLKINERKEKVAYLLEKVGLSSDMMSRFPHEFSGGQRQRIGIARAISADPEFIICDEPVSALDVSVQAHIINLLKDLQSELNLTYLFVAHDLAVVEHMSDIILVMNQGKIVEQGITQEICSNPQHPYSQRLLDAVPSI